MDIEVVFVLQVVGSKLAKAVPHQPVSNEAPEYRFSESNILSFVPSHNVGEADFV